MNCVITPLKTTPQINGFNESVVPVVITILINKNFLVKPHSLLLVSVVLKFSSQSLPILISQELSSDKITINCNKSYNSLKLDGILGVKCKPDELKLLDYKVDIYYISNH